MKVYKGIVKGNTVILEEKPDLPDECSALVEIKPLDQARDEEISRRQIALLKNPHKGGKLLYRRREELYDRDEMLIDLSACPDNLCDEAGR
jgi:hypothetical protein